MKRKTITARTGERLVRLAFELEELTRRLRDEGFDHEANGLRRVKDECGAVGRDLLDKLERKNAA
jgi:hypothetical protein